MDPNLQPPTPPEREPRRDLFDALFSLPLLRVLQPFFRAHREGLLYLFFGVLTTLVNWVALFLLERVGMHELIANLLAWILSVLVAFYTNRTWVFEAPAAGARAHLAQLLGFSAGRVGTLLLEEGILAIFVTWLALPLMPIKIASAVLVVLLNYFASKFLVFRKKK